MCSCGVQGINLMAAAAMGVECGAGSVHSCQVACMAVVLMVVSMAVFRGL